MDFSSSRLDQAHVVSLEPEMVLEAQRQFGAYGAVRLKYCELGSQSYCELGSQSMGVV